MPISSGLKQLLNGVPFSVACAYGCATTCISTFNQASVGKYYSEVPVAPSKPHLVYYTYNMALAWFIRRNCLE